MSIDESAEDLTALLALAETAGPLPPGCEERLWADTRHVYQRLVGEGPALDDDADEDTLVVELHPSRPALRARRAWLPLAAVATLVVAVVAAALLAGRPDADPVPPVGDPSVTAWAQILADRHDAFVADLVEADALRSELAPRVSLAAYIPWLDVVADPESVVAVLADPPPEISGAAAAYRAALDAWAAEAADLRAAFEDDADTFLFEGGLLADRLAVLRSLEVAALDVACAALDDAIQALAPSTPRLACGAMTDTNP